MEQSKEKRTLIEINDLKKCFKVPGGLLHAVDGVNLKIGAGDTLGLVGESGCGKSTLGRLILRLIEPTSGEIKYDGVDILRLNKKGMRDYPSKMQIIFQDPFASLNPRMSVFELIAEPLIMNHIYDNKADLTKRIFSMMDTVGLAARFVNAYPHEMDGGRRQRIGIARALALNPEFIVCDEPVSALDVSIQAQILNLLMDLQESMGLTYLFITHDLSVVKHISTDIAVMYLGQCVEKAPSSELFENPLHPYTKALLSAIPSAKLNHSRKKNIIRGEVSDPINPQPGCRFAPRCDHCSEKCRSHNFAMKEHSPNHFVVCNLFE